MTKNKKPHTEAVQWRVNTPQLLKEVIGNNETAFLAKPLQIFSNILFEVGERAAELNDNKLNALMCRLAIYEIADPYSKEYNAELTKTIIEKANTTSHDKSDKD